jgi:hypothetical protein
MLIAKSDLVGAWNEALGDERKKDTVSLTPKTCRKGGGDTTSCPPSLSKLWRGVSPTHQDATCNGARGRFAESHTALSYRGDAGSDGVACARA